MQSSSTSSSSSSNNNDQHYRKKATAFDHGIASNIAGSMTAVTFHPLDLIKIRIVSQDGTDLRKHQGQSYRSFSHALKSIVSVEGVSALFRGAPLGIVASGLSWGCYMTIYRWLEANLNALICFPLSATASSSSAMTVPSSLPVSSLASASSSVFVSFFTCPLFLIKTRMMLEDVKIATKENSSSKSVERVNKTFFHGVKHAIVNDGVRSLWRGFSAQLVMCCVMSIYMPLYEWIRHFACIRLQKEKLSKFETSCVTVCAKLGVTMTSHPVGLVKARLQDQRARQVVVTVATPAATTSSSSSVKYVSFGEACRTIIKREGFTGFYRGITVGLSQSMGRSIFQMLIYEDVLMKVMKFRNS